MPSIVQLRIDGIMPWPPNPMSWEALSLWYLRLKDRYQ